MTKEKIPIRPAIGQSFSIDVCKPCNVVWFDGGELARFQLDHEHRPAGREEQKAQERARDRTAEEHERFEELLAALPQSPGLLKQALTESALAVVSLAALGAVLLCLILNAFTEFPVWPTIAASVALGGAAAWAVVQTVGATARNLAVIVVATVALEALWIAFLLYAFGT
jgi:Zn-finger nucleic acid-binding protein